MSDTAAAPVVTLLPDLMSALAHAHNVCVARATTTRLDVANNADTISHAEACRLLAVADMDEQAASGLLELLGVRF